MTEARTAMAYPFHPDHPLGAPGEWTELRSKCPVAHITFPSGDPGLVATRYGDVRELLGETDFPRNRPSSDAPRVSADEYGGVFGSRSISQESMSGESHQGWRRLVGRWFTAKRMNQLAEVIEAKADSLIDDMVAQGAPADLKACIGFPLPVWVICEMLGVPESDHVHFAHWSNVLLNLDRFEQDEMNNSMAAFHEYMAGHVLAKRTARGDDLISELITADEEIGGMLGEEGIISTGLGLLVAGHETTANMIGKMLALLLADPSRWEALVADPGLVRTAVEEALRFDANAGFGTVRYVTEDYELAGETLRDGTAVVCSLAAANRDESIFENAGSMVLDRSPNPHLSFGSGAHSCLGQALARTELQSVLRVLLRRLPTLRLAVEPTELERVEGLVVGGLQTVPVQW